MEKTINWIKNYFDQKYSDFNHFIILDDPHKWELIEDQIKQHLPDDPKTITLMAFQYQYDPKHKKNKKDTIKLLNTSMEKGDMNAIFLLGYFHYYGQNCKQNYREAKRLLQIAVTECHIPATVLLATLYKDIPEEKNEQEAIKLYQSAITNNNAEAMYYLATIYKDKKNYRSAFKLYQQAFKIDVDHPLVQYGLAQMYQNGWGCQQNFSKALELYKNVINHPYINTIQNARSNIALQLGIMTEKGNGCIVDYKMAKECYELANQLHNLEAIVRLGILYKNGMGCDIDLEKAIRLFQTAKEGGNADAIYNLGVLHRDGIVYKQNYGQALKLFETASNMDNMDAMCALGIMYIQGAGCKQDVNKIESLVNHMIKKVTADVPLLGWISIRIVVAFLVFMMILFFVMIYYLFIRH